MKLIAGLGNVGEEYRDNRHNVGFMVVDSFAAQKTYDQWQSVEKFESLILLIRKILLLAKPQTMMNNSGKAVSSLAAFYKLHPSDIYVVYDDLDIVLGEYKIQRGKGPRDHKGLLSIYEKLGSSDFWHVRVGIENRNGDRKISGEEYVLQDFLDEEFELLNPVIDKIIKDLVKRFTE